MKKRTDKNVEMGNQEMEVLYERLMEYTPESEEYKAIYDAIGKQAEVIEKLAKAKSYAPMRNKINWEPIVSSCIVGGVAIAQIVLVMGFQEKGHLMDFKLINILKGRV